jgi:hypothetical protein
VLIISENWKMRSKHNWYSKLLRKYYKIRVNLTKPRHPVCDSAIREKAEKENQLVIQIPFGGLGDHLVYSSLPELLWEQKKIETFVSDKSVFRSRAIRDFVWKPNPYIEFTGRKGWFRYRPLNNSFLTIDEYLQNLFGLQADGCPKVYYKPCMVQQLEGKTIVDPSFGPSGKANGYYETDFHRRFIDFLEKNAGDFVLLVGKYKEAENPLEAKIRRLLQPPCYGIDSIKGRADALFSAERRYLMYSGSASLSAAMRLPSAVLCNRKAVPNFQYKVNNYVGLMQQ